MHCQQTYRSTPSQQHYCILPSWQGRPGGIQAREFCDSEYSYRFVCHLDMPVHSMRRLLMEIDVSVGPSEWDVRQALSEALLQRRLFAYPVTPLHPADPYLRTRTIRIERTDYQINHPSVRVFKEAQTQSFQTVDQARLFLDHFELDKAALCALIIEGDWKRNPQPWEEAELRQILAEQLLAGEMVITQAPAPVPPKPEPEPDAPPNDIGNRRANLGPHSGLHNQSWEGVEVKKDSFKTVKPVDMADLTADEIVAHDTLKRQGRTGRDIKQVLSSGDDFAGKELKPGDKLYGFDSTANKYGKKKQDSMYWLDEAGYQDVKLKFYKNGAWDREGVKNHLALPCMNRADVIDVAEVTAPQNAIVSTVGKAREQLAYTRANYTTGMLGKIMSGGGKQITPDASKTSAVTRLTGTP